MLSRAGRGWVVKHCHGADKGKRIAATPKPVSREKALSIHRAIQWRKSQARKDG